MDYLTVIISSVGGLLFGYDIGVMSGVFETSTFPLYFGKGQEGDLVALLQAGACLGALSANLYADRIGRQRSIMLGALIFLVGSTIQTSAQNLSMMLSGRFVGGWGVGACTMLIPMYIAEIAAPGIRGRLGALWQLNISVGMMLSFWINYACLIHLPTGNAQWRLPLGLQLIPGTTLLIGMAFLPESIRWLSLQGRVDEASHVLSQMRKLPEDHPDVVKELEQIASTAQLEYKSKWKQVIAQEPRRLVIGCFMQIAQQWTGTNAINYYGPLMFRTIGLDKRTSVLMTGVYGCVKVLFVLLSFFFLDRKKLGRRVVLIAGSTANLIIFFVLGGMLYAIESSNNHAVIEGYVAIVMIYLFAVSFEFSWGPMTWVVCSELFSIHIRAICISITTSMNWAMNAIIGKITPIMIDQLRYGTFLFYGVCSVLMGLVVYFFLPETKGKTLEETT